MNNGVPSNCGKCFLTRSSRKLRPVEHSYEHRGETLLRRIGDTDESGSFFRTPFQLLPSYPGYHVKWQSRTTRRRNHLERIQHIFPRFLAYKSGHSTNLRDASIVAKYKFRLPGDWLTKQFFYLKFLIDLSTVHSSLVSSTCIQHPGSSYSTLRHSPPDLAT